MSKRAEDFQNNHKQLYEVDSYSIEVVKELERNAYIAGEKETIERAVTWLQENIGGITGLIYMFRQAMEEQQ